jgi:steroid delta-isomerase-like uncharacterized protein
MSVQETMTMATETANFRGDAAFRFLGVPTQTRATAETTNGAFGLVEHWEMPPGFASPYHLHHREDEQFYVLEGEMAFVCDGKWVKGGPGTYVFGPREMAHGFKVLGEKPARMLLQCTPGGFERFVEKLGSPLSEPVGPPDMAKLIATAAEFGIDILGPLPEEPAEIARQRAGDGDLKSLNRQWIEAFNEQDWKTERAVRSEDFRAELSGMPEPLGNEAWSGFMQAFTSAFPDSRIQIEDCVSEGDRVVTRWVLTGTHRGAFQGIPASGKEVRVNGIEFNRVVDGKFVEHASQFDLAGLMRQIG